MSITVKQITNKFRYLSADDIKMLTGKSSNIQASDPIILSKLAAFNKNDIQIFAAQKEGKNFLDLIQGSRKSKVAKEAGIDFNPSNKTNPFGVAKQQNQNPALGAFIPPERKVWIG